MGGGSGWDTACDKGAKLPPLVSSAGLLGGSLPPHRTHMYVVDEDDKLTTRCSNPSRECTEAGGKRVKVSGRSWQRHTHSRRCLWDGLNG